MAQNNGEDKYKVRMYEARANAFQRQQEIDKLMQEMAELRRGLKEHKPNDFLASQNPYNNVLNSPETSLASSLSSFKDEVTNAIAVLTEKVISLQNNVKELSERGDETSRNFRKFQERMEKKIKDVAEEMEVIKKVMKNETNEQNALYHSVNYSAIENVGASKHLNNKIDEILQKFDEMENHLTIKFRSSIQILVIGGTGNCSDIFLLDCNEKTWKRVSINLPYNVGGHGTVILNDELYIIGGYINGSTISCHTSYRLNTEMKWEKLTNMHEERAYITNSCLSHNGCIWVIGGRSEYKELNTVEKYDPTTNRWEEKPAMKIPRGYGAAAVINNKIYACGGGSLSDSVEVFDIDSEIWTDFCTLSGPRNSMSIIVDGTSFILIGGYKNPRTENTVLKIDVEKSNKKWTHLPSLNEGRHTSSAVRIETGCILVFGGIETKENGKSQCSGTVEIFDGREWKNFTTLPEPRLCFTSVVLPPSMIDAFRPYVIS